MHLKSKKNNPFFLSTYSQIVLYLPGLVQFFKQIFLSQHTVCSESIVTKISVLKTLRYECRKKLLALRSNSLHFSRTSLLLCLKKLGSKSLKLLINDWHKVIHISIHHLLWIRLITRLKIYNKNVFDYERCVVTIFKV